MLEILKHYSIAFTIFLIIDLIWLGLVAKNLYKRELGFIMSDKPNWVAAIIFYLIFIAGLVFFVINPAIVSNSWTYALFAGMFLGFLTYATYDLTNLATLKNWPLKITIIDLIWGTTLGGSVSIITFFIAGLFK
ncbi:Uncharacterized membrane protein [Carnobacterium iners]|uniref:Uncharacterized membrane protein n=1 Tax=Carnobacterium iners TaxID=1073423 RepID=A0A1X7MTL5_9LACT|nr:DUF2177 family protein [Carnobacterium iners]SEK73469.1 Uncharacterized membrane protein [Carnobacterium iners]SMH27477.1 Uncharacterized membrane protein [Carnobacterium iners]